MNNDHKSCKCARDCVHVYTSQVKLPVPYGTHDVSLLEALARMRYFPLSGVAVERIYGDTGSRPPSLSGSDIVDLTQHHNGGVSMFPGGGGGGGGGGGTSSHHVTHTERSYHAATSLPLPQTSYMAESK